MINYNSDDSFDNYYFDDNLKKLWKNENESYEELAPLRNWEKADKYQEPTTLKLTKKEIGNIISLLVPSLIFSSVTSSVLVADISLAKFLRLIDDKGEYTISFPGKFCNFQLTFSEGHF